MRTTLDIDADLLDEAIRATGAPSKTVAVRLGLEALVDHAARRRLKALRGTMPKLKAPPRRRPVGTGLPR
ncbi:MAG TPA: type II toxin-antitoxin system VapB family antitoxin [Thermoanaerobaculia bacterium]|nr:type II toxin-antitoxin system VapB family antitoxin [Thermoanaerobaculia bacterium]